MGTPFWNQLARQPRHRAEDGSDALVRVCQGDGHQQIDVSAQLSDVSRGGAQVLIDRKLTIGSSVIIRIVCPAAGVDLGINAKVRWQRPEDDSLWSIGCHFEEQLEWEDYGELFLEGILESD